MLHFFLPFLYFFELASAQEWLVNTEYGDVRGFWSEQHKVWRFDGIPYAAAPLGALRHKAPVPPTPWDGVFDAVDDTVTCTQAGVDSSSEDCLVINVFVPESARTQGPLPVLFFLHGGAFVFGSSNGYNPYLTTRHDVVLVTINYRLGPFGYMCLGTDRIPGNAGFKDTIFALRWTNSNIRNFGGDPDAITIYGESASGYQTHALVLSNAAEGLFQRAIIESGSAMNEFGHNYDRLGKAKAISLSQGFLQTDDLDRLAAFLETVPATNLMQGASTFFVGSLCVERDIEGVEAAVPERFDLTLTSGNYERVPVMFVFTELESMLFSTGFYLIIDFLNNNFEFFLPNDIFIADETERNEVIIRIKEVYFNGAVITADSLRNYVEYSSDQQYFAGMYRSAVQHSLNSDSVYMMEFSYRGGFNQPNPFPQIPVASHADIVAYVMDLGHYNNETFEQDQIVRDRMTEMWTNFVKYGNPTPEGSALGVHWPQFTAEEQSYLNVGEQLAVRQRPYPARAQLWAEIYDKYFYPPPVFDANIRAGGSANVASSIVFMLGCAATLFVKQLVY